jgi:hypothetical protein
VVSRWTIDPDATNSVLLLKNLQDSEQGRYTVAVIDQFGAVFTEPAVLKLSRAATGCASIEMPTTDYLAPLIATDPENFLYSASHADGVSQRAPDGRLLWSTPFAGLPFALKIGSDGSAYVAGYRVGLPQVIMARYTSLGELLWSKPGPTAQPSSDSMDMRLDAEGNAILLLGGFGNGNLLMKVSPEGQTLWQIDFQRIGGPIPFAMELDTAGNVYVSGSDRGHAITIKYSPAGVYQWDIVEEDLLGWNLDLVLDQAGNIYLTSYAWQFPDGALMTVKYDADANRVWVARRDFAAQGYYTKHETAVDGAGNLYVMGARNETMLTLKYAPNGQLLWMARLPDPPDGHPTPRALTVDAAGTVLLSFYGTSSVGYYLDFARYDAEGNLRWRTRWAEPQESSTRFLQTFGAPGEIYVAARAAGEASIRKYCEANVAGLPTIISPPQGRSILLGESVTFSVTAAGAAPLRYQWNRDAQAIPGATNASLQLSNVYQGAGYSVRVENALGSIASPEALLTVHVPPSLELEPSDQCVPAGTVARFEVRARGEAPLRFQWSHNGTLLTVETNSVLLLPNVQAFHVGRYTVRVSNPYGEVTAVASLSLAPMSASVGSPRSTARTPVLGSPTWMISSAFPRRTRPAIFISLEFPGAPSINRPVDILTAKYDAGGTLQWAVTHGAPKDSPRRPTAIAVDSRGYVYVAVEDYDSSIAPAFGLKYRPDGQLDLEFRRGQIGPVTATALVVDRQDYVYFSGGAAFLTEKYDSAGTRLWGAVEPNGTAVTDMAVDFEGSVYVTGVQYNEARNGTELADFLTVKFDSEGGREWSRLYRAGDFLHDEPTKLALDREGNVVVAGLSSHSDRISLSYDISLVKYTPFGTQLWAVTHGTADATEWTVDMKVDRLGDIVVWGYSSGPLGVEGSP